MNKYSLFILCSLSFVSIISAEIKDLENSVETNQDDVSFKCSFNNAYPYGAEINVNLLIKNLSTSPLYCVDTMLFYDYEIDIKSPSSDIIKYDFEKNNRKFVWKFRVKELKADKEESLVVNLFKLNTSNQFALLEKSNNVQVFDRIGRWSCKITRKLYRKYPDDFFLISTPEFSFQIGDPNSSKNPGPPPAGQANGGNLGLPKLHVSATSSPGSHQPSTAPLTTHATDSPTSSSTVANPTASTSTSLQSTSQPVAGTTTSQSYWDWRVGLLGVAVAGVGITYILRHRSRQK